MTKKINAIFTDLDGTLLNDDKNIGAEDKKTIQMLIDKEIKVFLATGRHFAATRYYANQLNSSYPCLCCNGGLIYDFKKESIVSSVTFPKEDAKALGEFAVANKMSFYTYSENCITLSKNDMDNFFFQGLNSIKKIVRENEIVFCEKEEIALAENIVTFAFSDCTDEKYQKLLESDIVKSGKYRLDHSGRMFVDFTCVHANKGDAVKKMCGIYGLDTDNIVCMGDNYNDRTMLDIAGISVVPASAEESLRKTADFVTSSCNENPLTYLVDNLLLKENLI